MRPGVRAWVLVSSIVPCTLVLASACGSSHNDSSPLQIDDGGGTDRTTADTGKKPDGAKPPPAPRDAGGGSDAKPPPPPPSTKPDAGTDAGKLVDAGAVDASSVGSTATPLDPIDEALMPDFGLDVGTCSEVGLSDGTGVCKTSYATGQDYVEGCIDPTAYLLDCARYETAGSVRSICDDNLTTKVGCILLDVTPVDAFEKSQTASALDLFHPCPSSWEGYGYCEGDFVSMCVGGEDYALDCTIYNTGGFTYTCGKDSTTGKITCL